MKSQSFTPGPWTLFPSNPLCIEAPSGNVGLVNLARGSEADARLMSAAPDLLAAAKRAKAVLEPELEKEPDRTVFWELVEAIRKAEGSEPLLTKTSV